jgi:hypothetical protein
MSPKLLKLVKQHNKRVNRKPKSIRISLYTSYDDSSSELEQYKILSHQLAHEEQTLYVYRV